MDLARFLVVFGGITEGLIPLFAVGAFLAFTMSQAAMLVHWRRQRHRHARFAMIVNALGAAATGVTLVVILGSKFVEGAWISAVLIAGLVLLFRNVRRHYDLIDRATATNTSLDVGPPRPAMAVVPLRRWDALGLKALRFALGFAPEVVAVQVLTDDAEVEDLSSRWGGLVEGPAHELGIEPPRLVVLRSPYRQLFAPLVDFIAALARDNPDRQVAVVVPELVEARWYHYLLHNQTASLIKALLLFQGGPQVVVVSAPWYLRDWIPERRWLLARSGRALFRRRR